MCWLWSTEPGSGTADSWYRDSNRTSINVRYAVAWCSHLSQYMFIECCVDMIHYWSGISHQTTNELHYFSVLLYRFPGRKICLQCCFLQNNIEIKMCNLDIRFMLKNTKFLFSNKNANCYRCNVITWRIQDFPEEGAPTPQGAPTYDFTKISQKLHGI